MIVLMVAALSGVWLSYMISVSPPMKVEIISGPVYATHVEVSRDVSAG